MGQLAIYICAYPARVILLEDLQTCRQKSMELFKELLPLIATVAMNHKLWMEDQLSKYIVQVQEVALFMEIMMYTTSVRTQVKENQHKLLSRLSEFNDNHLLF